jgi:hypothetical protein
MKQNEHNLQVSCITWFHCQYPQHIIYAIPNGGQRNVIIAAKMKAEGVLSGVPDLHIPLARKGYHGLYIEMKAGKNKTTERQNAVIRKLEKEGYKCNVCYSFDEFVNTINDYIL